MLVESNIRDTYFELDISIQELQPAGTRTLCKIQFGEQIAEISGLNSCNLNKVNSCTVVIPSYIMAVNSSFLDGLFKKLVKEYGLETFNSKVLLLTNKKSLQNSLDIVKIEALNRITRAIEHSL
jgi:hypothetical protein